MCFDWSRSTAYFAVIRNCTSKSGFRGGLEIFADQTELFVPVTFGNSVAELFFKMATIFLNLTKRVLGLVWASLLVNFSGKLTFEKSPKNGHLSPKSNLNFLTILDHFWDFEIMRTTAYLVPKKRFWLGLSIIGGNILGKESPKMSIFRKKTFMFYNDVNSI